MPSRFASVSDVTLLYRENVRVVNEQLLISLSADSGLTLSRELTRSDGASFGQIVSLQSASDVFDFSAADPYEGKLERCYETIKKYVVDATATAPVSPATVVDPLQAISELSGNLTEGELLSRVRRIVAVLGGTQFIYQWVRFEGKGSRTDDPVEARYLVGCRPAWLQQYIARLWYMNDPHLSYARSSAAPALAAHINIHRADHWLVTEARMHGLASGVIVPAHSPAGRGLVGILQVSNGMQTTDSESLLWKNHVLLRALSCALLDWQITQVRKKAASQYNLSDDETLALKTLRAGGGASHIADQLGVSVSTVYKSIFRHINKKTGVSRINEAVEKVTAVGLLD